MPFTQDRHRVEQLTPSAGSFTVLVVIFVIVHIALSSFSPGLGMADEEDNDEDYDEDYEASRLPAHGPSLGQTLELTVLGLLPQRKSRRLATFCDHAEERVGFAGSLQRCSGLPFADCG